MSLTNSAAAVTTAHRSGAVGGFFAIGIFLGSYLLFVVQPLIARFILPWFGGAPATWTVCMLFFQTLLLGGYAYAHFLHRRLAGIRQQFVHVGMVLLSLLTLPVIPDEGWKPPGAEAPEIRILLLLLVTVGFPYFLLAASSPLLQAWYVQALPGCGNPYRLFALSNAGSLLALLGFPFLVEPLLSSNAQAAV